MDSFYEHNCIHLLFCSTLPTQFGCKVQTVEDCFVTAQHSSRLCLPGE